MCGRYYMDGDDLPEDLLLIIETLQRRTGTSVKLGEIFPTDTAPVIANSRAGKPAPFAMRWGYTVGRGAPVINARSETAAQRPLFRDGMARRRCLIPASYYFEWEKRGNQKIRYAIKAGRVIYMAGLYRLEEAGPAFTVLTREPAENIAFIHNRMPVILPKEAHAAWLDINRSPGDALSSSLLNVQFDAV